MGGRENTKAFKTQKAERENHPNLINRDGRCWAWKFPVEQQPQKVRGVKKKKPKPKEVKQTSLVASFCVAPYKKLKARNTCPTKRWCVGQAPP